MNITNLINYEQFYCGIPTEIPQLCSIYPATLREIARVGVKNFYSYLNLFTLTKEDISDFMSQAEITSEVEMAVLDFHLYNSDIDKAYQENFCNALRFFLREDKITFLTNNGAIVLGEIQENRIIRQEEYEAICKIILLQHSVDETELNEDNPSDAKAAQILKQMRENKKKLNQAKPNSELSFVDLVASLAAKGNGLNALNVWDLTYFAFNDQFKRMQYVEEYDNQLRALLAGAGKKGEKLKHWIRPVQKDD